MWETPIKLYIFFVNIIITIVEQLNTIDGLEL